MRKIEFLKTKLYFILAALLLTAVCIGVYTSSQNGEHMEDVSHDPAQEQVKAAENETEDAQQASSVQHSDSHMQDMTAADGENVAEPEEPKETTYVLNVTDGYLEVYIAQTKTHYMETEIAYDLLPERVQKEIDEGKYFESEEDLLEFLENYSS